jgi:hypothetical protein
MWRRKRTSESRPRTRSTRRTFRSAQMAARTGPCGRSSTTSLSVPPRGDRVRGQAPRPGARPHSRSSGNSASSVPTWPANGLPSETSRAPPSRSRGSADIADSSYCPPPPRDTRAESGNADRDRTTRTPFRGSYSVSRDGTISRAPHPTENVEPLCSETACSSRLRSRRGCLGSRRLRAARVRPGVPC